MQAWWAEENSLKNINLTVQNLLDNVRFDNIVSFFYLNLDGNLHEQTWLGQKIAGGRIYVLLKSDAYSTLMARAHIRIG